MDRDPQDQPRAGLRASDADREQFVEALRRHHTEGRLTTEELAERSERAYGAKTYGDLDALATDLPPAAPPARPAPEDLPARLRPLGPKQAAARAGLVRSVLWYGVLSVFLIVVWAISGRDYFWPAWPILGFMLLLAWQAIGVWYWPRRSGDQAREPGDR